MMSFPLQDSTSFTQTYCRTLTFRRFYEKNIIYIETPLISILVITGCSKNVHSGAKLTLVVGIKGCRFKLTRERIRVDFTGQLRF